MYYSQKFVDRLKERIKTAEKSAADAKESLKKREQAYYDQTKAFDKDNEKLRDEVERLTATQERTSKQLNSALDRNMEMRKSRDSAIESHHQIEQENTLLKSIVEKQIKQIEEFNKKTAELSTMLMNATQEREVARGDRELYARYLDEIGEALGMTGAFHRGDIKARAVQLMASIEALRQQIDKLDESLQGAQHVIEEREKFAIRAIKAVAEARK